MSLRIDQNGMRKGLFIVAAVNMVVAAGFWLWNPEPDTRPHQGTSGRVASSPQGVAPVESRPDNAAIIAANIFSASRTPPRQRYNPAEDAFGGPDEAAAPMNPVEVAPPPQLFGTVVGPSGAMALMQGDSASGPGTLYREGDKIGGYRLVKVKSNSVIMSGPSGRFEIQVQRGPTGTQ